MVIGSDDPITICGHGCQCRVDCVAQSGTSEQYTGTPAQLLVEGNGLDRLQGAGEASLVAGAAAPDLGDHTTVGHRRTS